MLEQKIVTGGEIALYDEIGRIGQNRWGGSFYEEFLPELRGQRGVKVYTEMESNDDVIGAIIFALDTLLRQAQFSGELLPVLMEEYDCIDKDGKPAYVMKGHTDRYILVKQETTREVCEQSVNTFVDILYRSEKSK